MSTHAQIIERLRAYVDELEAAVDADDVVNIEVRSNLPTWRVVDGEPGERRIPTGAHCVQFEWTSASGTRTLIDTIRRADDAWRTRHG